MTDKTMLSNSVEMPKLGFGTWRLGGGSEVTDAVTAAIEAGFRKIDTAYSYGGDFYIGRAVKKVGIRRDELFITNKLWTDFMDRDSAVAACKKSLKLMKLDYFDLYLIHWPAPENNENWREINLSAWRGMEELYTQGLIRAAGVSNFTPAQLAALTDGGISVMPCVNQIEFHPRCSQGDSMAFCRDRGITVEGWSPLGSGGLLEDGIITETAGRLGITPAQLCLAWALEKGVCPVCRTKNPERMAENLAALGLKIPVWAVEALDSM